MSTYPLVLYVEDIEYWYRKVRRILSENEYGKLCDVDWAKTKRECMDLVANNNYSLILMDLHLFGPDVERQGYDLTLKLLDYFIEEHRKIAVAILSSHTNIDEILKGYDAGAFDVIPKPKTIQDEKVFYKKIEAIIFTLGVLTDDNVSDVACDANTEKTHRRLQTYLRYGNKHITLDEEDLQITGKPLIILSALIESHYGAFPEALMEEADVGRNSLNVHISKIRSIIKPFNISIDFIDEKYIIR